MEEADSMNGEPMEARTQAAPAPGVDAFAPSVGLALSGGGVEGFAHIGTCRALGELGVRADAIAGTSSGSIVAALTALGCTTEEIFDATERIYRGVSSISPIRLTRAVIGFLRRGKTGVDGLIDTELHPKTWTR